MSDWLVVLLTANGIAVGAYGVRQWDRARAEWLAYKAREAARQELLRRIEEL